jgi:hypothetical protein
MTNLALGHGLSVGGTDPFRPGADPRGVDSARAAGKDIAQVRGDAIVGGTFCRSPAYHRPVSAAWPFTEDKRVPANDSPGTGGRPHPGGAARGGHRVGAQCAAAVPHQPFRRDHGRRQPGGPACGPKERNQVDADAVTGPDEELVVAAADALGLVRPLAVTRSLADPLEGTVRLAASLSL